MSVFGVGFLDSEESELCGVSFALLEMAFSKTTSSVVVGSASAFETLSKNSPASLKT